MTLSAKSCIPCRKGTLSLEPDTARVMLGELSGWEIDGTGQWLQKSYKLKNFAEALSFVNKVGALAEAENHHPDLTFGWGYVNIKLQTHAAGGLHENDFILAAKIDTIQ